MEILENRAKSLPLLVVGSGFSILFVGLYLRDLQRDDLASGGGRQVGTLENAVSDVSRRPRSRLLWVPAGSGVAVFEKDTLRTGEDSFARVQLNDSGVVELQPDSLAVLETQEGGLKVNLASGDLFISGKVEAQIGKTKIVSVGKDGGIRIQKQRQSGEISVETQGSAKAKILTSDGKTQEVKAGERITQSTETAEIKIETFKWQVESPTPGKVLPFSWDAPLKVEFAFKNLNTDSTAQISNPILQIFSSNKKKQIQQLPIDTSGKPIKVNFEKSGKYFWRLVENEKQLIPFSPLTLNQEAPPKAGLDSTKPAPSSLGLNLNPDDSTKSILVGKNLDPAVEGVEISLDGQKWLVNKANFDSQGNWKLEIPSKTLEDSRKGELLARNIFPASQWSSVTSLKFDPQKFSLGSILLLAPQLISPSKNRNLALIAIEKSGLKLTWDFPKNSFYPPKVFQIEIRSIDPGTSSKIQLESSTHEVILSKLPPAGNYEWIVKPLFEGGKTGTPSLPRKFSLIATKVRTPASFQRPGFVFEGDE